MICKKPGVFVPSHSVVQQVLIDCSIDMVARDESQREKTLFTIWASQIFTVRIFRMEVLCRLAPFFTPGFLLKSLKHYAMPWWLTTEDLPDPDNRVTISQHHAAFHQ